MISPALTVNGLLRVMGTDDCVSVTVGELVAFNVVTVGRVGGVVCGLVTLRYMISGFASVTFTLEYVPAGIELRSSSVCNPLSRAKSTVCVPLNTDTGGFTPSDTVRPVMSTWNDTTLGNGASVPLTNTLPLSGCVGVVLEAPPPQPEAVATSASTAIRLSHF